MTLRQGAARSAFTTLPTAELNALTVGRKRSLTQHSASNNKKKFHCAAL